MLTRGPDGNDVYTADMHRSYLTLEQVRLQHGPVRPIVPITDADRQALFNLLAAAKRKAVYSVGRRGLPDVDSAARRPRWHGARTSRWRYLSGSSSTASIVNALGQTPWANTTDQVAADDVVGRCKRARLVGSTGHAPYQGR
jgi:hypothetical protein